MATLNPQIAEQTLTIGSLGKTFYATGWRVGYVIGPKELITSVCQAHTRICKLPSSIGLIGCLESRVTNGAEFILPQGYATPGPPQVAGAVGFSEAEKRGFWDEAREEMKAKMDRLNKVWDEIGLPVGQSSFCSTGLCKANSWTVRDTSRRIFCSREHKQDQHTARLSISSRYAESYARLQAQLVFNQGGGRGRHSSNRFVPHLLTGRRGGIH